MNEYDDWTDMILDFLKQAIESDDCEYEDSREKLEADVLELVKDGYVAYSQIIEMLDRQRAIDDSICDECSSDYYEMQEEHDQMLDGIAKLMRKQPYTFDYGKPLENIETIGRYIDELTAERDELKAKLNYLKAYGVTISEPFCGGYEVYNEAIRERDKLKADLEAAYAKNRSLRQHISQMQNGRNEWHVKAVSLEKQLEAVNKQCERYRELLSRVRDNAHDAFMAMDEGLA